MAQPTLEELEARRTSIDEQLTRLSKLPARYTIGATTVDNASLMNDLRVERDSLERQIRSLDDDYGQNSMSGPEIVIS